MYKIIFTFVSRLHIN